MKKIISLVTGISMLFLSGSPIFAATGCQNNTTGFQSTNVCNMILSKLHTLNLNNSGVVLHTTTQNITSGNNVVANNTVSTDLAINSGSANAVIDSGISFNSSAITLSQTDEANDQVGSNTITGSNSINTVNVSNMKTVTLNVTNDGSVVHTVAVAVNSGGNTVSNNTISGAIQTGNASVQTSVQTFMNSIIVSINE